jgi:hypothetical protein
MNQRAWQKIFSQINGRFSSHEINIKTINQSIETMDQRMNEMGHSLNSIHNHLSSKQRIEEQVAIDAASFDKMNAYVNLIIFGGYAGFFAIWSFTNDQLPEKARIWTGLLVGISLLFFISWEVLRASLQSSSVVKAFKLSLENLEANEYQAQRSALKKKTERQTKLLINLWGRFLLLTVLPGLAGGLLLAYNFVATLIAPIPHWPS